MQLSITEASQNVDSGKKCADGLVDSAQCPNLSQTGLITETQKDCEVNEFSETHPCSSSGCIDEFLADLEEVDCENSYSANDALKSSRSGSNNSKEAILTFDDKNGVGTDAGTELEVLLVSSEQAERDIPGEPKSDADPIKIEEKRKDSKWPSNESPIIKIGLHVGHASKKQDCVHSLAQVTRLASYSKREKFRKRTA